MSSKAEEYASFTSMEKILMRKCDVFSDMKGLRKKNGICPYIRLLRN